MADGFQPAAGAASFAQFAVDADPCADEQRNGRGQSGDEGDETESLAGVFAELVGHEQARAHAHGHFRHGGQGGARKVL